MASPIDLARLRLAAQGIAGPGQPTVGDVVQRLMCVQAQDLPGAIMSIALRTRSRRRADVVQALTDRVVVRSWPMRGTLHFVLGQDLGWILKLSCEGMLKTSARRRCDLGLEPDVIERARSLAVNALEGGRALGRAELVALWQRAGLATEGQRSYHLIGVLAQTGTLCFGPMREKEQLLVLLPEWVPAPRHLDREEALGELARRYFTGHGPATVRDFTGWTKLRAADVRAAIAHARPGLERLEVAGIEYLMDPATPQLASHLAGELGDVHLLPGFDEFILGYQDRSAVLAAEYADLIVPGGNGVFRATVVAGGIVVGTWKQAGRAGARTIEVSAFTPLDADVDAAVARLYRAFTSMSQES